MPSSLFGPMEARPTNNQPTAVTSQTSDPVAVAESALRQSGGDARAAFYSLAQAKGVDPEAFLRQFNGSNMMNQALKSSPSISRLMSLASFLSGK